MPRSLPLFALLLFASAAAAQPADPGDVAMDYVQATLRLEHAQAAALLHPEALEGVKVAMIATYRGEQDAPELERVLGVRTPEEVEALPADQVWVRVMESQLGERKKLSGLLQDAQVRLLGVVREAKGPSGQALAHALYRIELPQFPPQDNHIATVTLKQHNGQWRALLSKEFKLPRQ